MAEGDITKDVKFAVRSDFATPVALMVPPDYAARARPRLPRKQTWQPRP